jgi:Protein of unknown function (DUF2939)
MKWAAAILAVMLYLVWPYYTSLTLAGALRTGDAAILKEMVDWDRVRASLKFQLRAHLESEARQREPSKDNSGFAALGNALALTFVDRLIDNMVTPTGLANLIQGTRIAAAGKTQPTKVTTKPSPDPNQQPNLFSRVKFAFFVSPIHFQIDLRDPNASAENDRVAVTLILMFKGTGWQLIDMRLPKSGLQQMGSTKK